MKIKFTTISFLLNILFGLCFIAYIIYLRVFRVRLPKSLYFIQQDLLQYSLVIFVLISICLSCYILVYNTLELLERTKTSNNKLSYFSQKFNSFITKALQEVYYSLEYFLTDGYNTISTFCSKFYNFFCSYGEYTFLFILYAVRLIILFSFLVDVLVHFKLVYFYKCLFLLCISLCIQVLFFILRDFTKNLDELHNILIIKDCGIDEETQLPITNYSFQPGYEKLNLRYYISQFIICNKLTGYLEMYDRYANFFNPRVNIFIYTLYLSGWLYVLYVNFMFFW